jgi:hypothetical protein
VVKAKLEFALIDQHSDDTELHLSVQFDPNTVLHHAFLRRGIQERLSGGPPTSYIIRDLIRGIGRTVEAEVIKSLIRQGVLPYDFR